VVDITMCRNMVCPLKTTCYRQTASASSWQSMTVFDYCTEPSGEVSCEYYCKDDMKESEIYMFTVK